MTSTQATWKIVLVTSIITFLMSTGFWLFVGIPHSFTQEADRRLQPYEGDAPVTFSYPEDAVVSEKAPDELGQPWDIYIEEGSAPPRMKITVWPERRVEFLLWEGIPWNGFDDVLRSFSFMNSQSTWNPGPQNEGVQCCDMENQTWTRTNLGALSVEYPESFIVEGGNDIDTGTYDVIMRADNSAALVRIFRPGLFVCEQGPTLSDCNIGELVPGTAADVAMQQRAELQELLGVGQQVRRESYGEFQIEWYDAPGSVAVRSALIELPDAVYVFELIEPSAVALFEEVLSRITYE